MHYIQKYSYVFGIGTTLLLTHSISAQAENLSNTVSNIPENGNFSQHFLTASDWSFSTVSKISQLTPISPKDTPRNPLALPAIINLDAFITKS